MANNELIDRTLGKYSISIGTSVALECFFGTSDDKPLRVQDVPPYLNYQCIMANIRTLCRNYLSSYKSQELPSIPVKILYDRFVAELILINNVVNSETDGKIIVSFYINTYLKLNKYLRKANIKKSYTEKQQYLIGLETKFCELINADPLVIKSTLAYEHTNDIMRQGKRRNVIITHYPMDLILTNLNPDILESHTGKVKRQYEFPSKLKRAGDNVPFNKYTLQVLGDSSGYIMSATSSLRNELMKVCKDSGITPVTPEPRFIKTVKSAASSELRSLMSGM